MWLRICSCHYTGVSFIFIPLKLKEKPISKLKNAASDPKAESWADGGAELCCDVPSSEQEPDS